jgi:membrane peptidoglycan carboxypeptidase
MVPTRRPRVPRRRHPRLGERIAPWIAMLIALNAWTATVVRSRVAPAVVSAYGTGRVVIPRWAAALRWAFELLAQWAAVGAALLSLGAVWLLGRATLLVRRFSRPVGLAAAGVGVVVALAGYSSGPVLRFAASVVAGDIDGPSALPPLEQPSVVVAANGRRLGVFRGPINRRVVSLDEVPAHVRHAVLSAEDRRFAKHRGYDFEAIGRAALTNVRAGGVRQGGSTITQQVAKALFTNGDRTFSRKLDELLYAVALERELTKDQILERYLNQVYFGSGAYGIAAAADELFRMTPEDLTVDQAALLAGLIRSPGALDPRATPKAVVARRNAVLRAMGEEGYLSSSQVRRHSRVKLRLAEPLTAPRRSHLLEAVKREAQTLPALGRTPEERTELLYTGGLRISTSIRPRLQSAAAATVADHLSAIPAQGALAAVDPRSGSVLALAGGASFRAQQFDLATQARRQPGSAFKPFVAAAALAAGLAPGQSLAGDGPVEIDVPGAPRPWRVDNYESADHGTVTMREAMAASVNTAFAQLGVGIGPDAIADVAQRVGIDTARALGPENTHGPAVALGGITHGVTPLEMASAYGVFATEGVHRAPHVITEIRRADEPVYRAAESARRALPKGVTAHVRDMLRDVIRDGTGTHAQVRPWDAVGKTGTTQNHADAWFVGTTPSLSAAVWIGDPEGQRSVPGLTGGTVPARVWREFVESALRPQAPKRFPDLPRRLPDGGGVALPDAERVDAAP